jgi:hypothetical protein
MVPSEDASLVVDVAVLVAEVAGATVRSVHVEDGTAVAPVLLDALAAPDVIGAVLGAGRPDRGPGELGATVRAVVEGSDKPVVIVPRSLEATPGEVRRVLLPIEDRRATTRALERGVAGFLDRRLVDLELVHVLGPEGVPPILDRPTRDVATLADELRARHLPEAAGAVVRAGPVGNHVAAMCHPASADLVALLWHQDVSEGRARIVKAVLRSATVPVLLLPAGGVGEVS